MDSTHLCSIHCPACDGTPLGFSLLCLDNEAATPLKAKRLSGFPCPYAFSLGHWTRPHTPVFLRLMGCFPPMASRSLPRHAELLLHHHQSPLPSSKKATLMFPGRLHHPTCHSLSNVTSWSIPLLSLTGLKLHGAKNRSH